MAKRSAPFLIAFLVALALAAPVAARTDGAGASARSAHATLIDVHRTYAGRDRARPSSGANCSNEQASGNLFAYTSWKVAGARTAHLNTATVPGGLSNVPGALQASFDAWRGADSAVPRITVATDGTGTKATANHLYELMWGRAGGSTIAVTYTWLWNDGSIESDTVFNSRLSWFTASSFGDGCYESTAKYDVRNIATHEFGHTYGMGHPGNDRFETMYAYGYTGETVKWTLATGDTNGIRGLY